MFKYDNVLIPKARINSTVKRLRSELKKVYSYPCIQLPFNNIDGIEAIISLKKRLNPKLIIVVGIGGSNLGTMAIQEALGKTGILYADTVDPDYLQFIITEMQNVLRQGSQVLINVISKSGTTTETIANFEVLYNVLKRHRKDGEKYVVVTTDKDSKLWSLAMKQGWSVLEIPKDVGGRYSVFTAVGLFPLGMLGINIKQLLEGARTVKIDSCAISASILFNAYKKGLIIYDHFMFAKSFESLGKWYRQLLAESCGKDKVGITPTVSIGSIDLHSMAQLYLDGPNNKLTNFVSTSFNSLVKVPFYNEFNSLVENLQKKELNHLMHAIFLGVKATYKKNKRAFTETLISKSEQDIGEFMQFKMLETILLAKLLNVNPFDQPAVELYKSETRKILGK